MKIQKGIVLVGCLLTNLNAMGAVISLQFTGEGRQNQSRFDPFLDDTIVPTGLVDGAPFGSVGERRAYRDNYDVVNDRLINPIRNIDELDYEAYASFDRLGASVSMRDRPRYNYSFLATSSAFFSDTYTITALDSALNGTTGVGRYNMYISGGINITGEYVEHPDFNTNNNDFFRASYEARTRINGSLTAAGMEVKNFVGQNQPTQTSGTPPGVVTGLFSFTYGQAFDVEASLGTSAYYQLPNSFTSFDDNVIEANFLNTLTFGDFDIVEWDGSGRDKFNDYNVLDIAYRITTESGVNAFAPAVNPPTSSVSEPAVLGLVAMGLLAIGRFRRVKAK